MAHVKKVHSGAHHGAAHIKERAKGWIKGRKVSLLVKEHGSARLEKVISACENIWKVTKEVAHKKSDLFDLCLYIKTKLTSQIKKGNYYLDKKKTSLANAIEYDPKSKNIFIHSEDGVGKGKHKKVTRSVLYSDKTPELVANCSGSDKTVQLEAKVLKKVGNKPGLPKVYAITRHKDRKSHKKITSLLIKFYNGDTMDAYMQKEAKLNKRECMQIARELRKRLDAFIKTCS